MVISLAVCFTSHPSLFALNCCIQFTLRPFCIFCTLSLPYSRKEEVLLLGNARVSAASRCGAIAMCRIIIAHYLFPPELNTLQDYRFTHAFQCLCFQNLLLIFKNEQAMTTCHLLTCRSRRGVSVMTLFVTIKKRWKPAHIVTARDCLRFVTRDVKFKQHVLKENKGGPSPRFHSNDLVRKPTAVPGRTMRAHAGVNCTFIQFHAWTRWWWRWGSVSRCGRFTPGEMIPGTHLVWVWVAPRIGLDSVKKRNMSGIDILFLGCPAHSRSHRADWAVPTLAVGHTVATWRYCVVQLFFQTLNRHSVTASGGISCVVTAVWVSC
jgi:hypothetical protein